MAFIRLKNHQARFVSPEQGAAIWRILNGEIIGTRQQREFVKLVAKVYLNPANAPRSYLVALRAEEEARKSPQLAIPYWNK